MSKLAGVAVPKTEYTLRDAYEAQKTLQLRLNQLPGERQVEKSIYWFFCIRAETIELLEWLHKREDPTAIKELQFEAIDIVHFVFNLGLEAFIHPDEIDVNYEFQDWVIETKRIEAALAILELEIVKHIEKMPWKTWKKYNTEEPVFDFTQVLKSLLLVCNACGLSKQDTIDMYFAKNAVNHGRQDAGY